MEGPEEVEPESNLGPSQIESESPLESSEEPSIALKSSPGQANLLSSMSENLNGERLDSGNDNQNDTNISSSINRTQFDESGLAPSIAESLEKAQDNNENKTGCRDLDVEQNMKLEDFELNDDVDADVSYTPLVSGSVKTEESLLSTTSPNISSRDFSDSEDQSPAPREDSPGVVLRHRLDPEPPTRPEDTDPALITAWDDPVPRNASDRRKVSQIKEALAADPVDVQTLRKLAISPGGLVNKHMRKQVWPLLLNVNTNNITPKPSTKDMEAMSKTYSQVVMDVNRSSGRFPPGIDEHVRMSMKDKLVDLIMRVMLKHNGELKYYQGFHDVCITFLLCMDEDLAFVMVDKLATSYMREYLDETMERTSLLLNFIFPLVNKCNPELCQHMERNDLGTIFALSWVITWFSHVLGDIRRILRVFDFFLASHRMMPVYLSAAFVLHREQDIFDAGDEMGYIHKCLSVIPKDLPIESLLERAGDLYLQYPPTEISEDPMLIQMNKNVYEHFNRIDSRNARRRAAQQASEARSRLFVRVTMWSLIAVVGVASAVVYTSYSSMDWTKVDVWSPFS